MEMTDRNLIDAHIKGDPSSFDVLVRRHGPALLGYLIKMTKNTQQAEDFFQETFQKVHLKGHTFQGESFKPWLFKIATNVAMSGFKKAKRNQALSLNQNIECENGNCPQPAALLQADVSSNPAVAVMRDERIQQVKDAIELLPPKQRAALVLAYYQQQSYSNIAEILNCSIGTVKTHMFRALKTLARKLPDTAGGVL